MPVEVAQAILNITPSMRGLQALIDREMRGVDSRRAGRDAGDGYSSGFGASAKKLTGVLAGAFAAVKVGDFAKDAVAQASDLAEAGSKLQVVFGDATGSVNDFASGGAKAFGQSKLAIQNAAAQFGVYGKAAGLAGSANADFSKNLVGLSTDLASFYNTDPAQAAEAISAGLRGESEPLRQYGVLLDDATLRNKALQLGLITTTKDALTPANKVLAAQASIMEQTTLAQGDFARTSGGLANQQRILAAQWTDMKGKLGQAFLPAVTATVTALNERLFPVLSDLGAKASGAWSILAHGDFKGESAGLGAEDSPLVSALFTARETYLKVAPQISLAWDALTKGFDPTRVFGGENNPLVAGMLKAHDTFESLKPQLSAAWDALTSGFDQSRITGQANSPLVDLALKLRDFGLTTFDKLKDIWATLWDTAQKLWQPIKDIASAIFDAVSNLSGNGLTVWSVLLDVFQKIADSLHSWLVPALTWLARFMQENPASVMTFVGVILAVIGALKVWTVVQGILDALLSANPIGLVVVALAAFAAAVVWAYNNVGWFHDAVDTAWAFIQAATSALFDGVIKPAFTWLSENIHVVGDFFVGMWAAAQPVFDFLKNSWDNFVLVIQGVIDVVVGVFTGDWQRAWDGVKEIFTGAWNQIVNYVQTAWTLISGAFTAAWDITVKPVLGWINDALSTTGRFFMDLWNNTVSPVWSWIQDKISTVWLWLNQNVFAPLNLAIGTIGTFFMGLWTTVQTVWNNVSTFFVNVATGIDNAVTKVKTAITDISTAIDGFFQRFTNWGGTQAGGVLGTINLNPHATGTIVPGYAPGVDNYPALLSPGEAVLVPQLTRQLGAPKILEANRRAYMGADGASVLRFAQGGVIGGQQAGDLIYARTKALLDTKQKEMESTAAGSASVNLAEFNSSQDPSSFGWARAVGMVPFSFAGLGTSVAGGTPGLWAALLNALAPSIPGGVKTLGGFENRNNVNNPSVPSFHAYGLAMDVNAPWNPNGVSGYGRAGQYIIPSGPAHSLAAQYGMLWGGDFSGTPDPMHFEIHLPPSAIGGAVAGALGGAVPTVGASTTTGGGFPAAVERWRATVEQSLAFIKQPLSLANTVLNQMRTESSGDPNIANLTDINAQRGDPSIGLIQVIGSTFRNTLAAHGLSNLVPRGQRDPFVNLVAGELYSIDRYGSIAKGMRGVAYANGGIVPGFGGTDSVRAFLTPGEGVLPKPQVDAYITHAKALEAGFSGQMPSVVINLDNSDPLQVAVAQMIDAGLTDAAASVRRRAVQTV
jgi:hypothetical protein